MLKNLFFSNFRPLEGPDPVPILDQLRAAGTTVVAVGIGPQVVPEDLNKLAGPTGAVFIFRDFDQLDLKFVPFVKQQLC